jgi:hybrid cluster-associated redox disulfide protein
LRIEKKEFFMITKDTLIYDALQQKPEAVSILGGFGMHCLGCPMSRGETIEQACLSHGIDLDMLLAELNKK